MEAIAEQRDERASEVGMRDERGGDVVLAERCARLAQVVAVRPQHRDLAPREPGGEHEPVEGVVLGGAGDDGGERVLEGRARDRRRRG